MSLPTACLAQPYLQVISAPCAVSFGLLGESLALGGPRASATMLSTVGCSVLHDRPLCLSTPCAQSATCITPLQAAAM